MYFAQDTATTHHFNHSRKKPPRAKVKPTHRQGPLFADMLHETTLEQKEHAHRVCGRGTVYNDKGAIHLRCGRRDCPICFKLRYRKIAARIRMYLKDTEEAGLKQKLKWKKIPSWQHAKVTREIKGKTVGKIKGEYICLPVINKDGEPMEYILSNVIEGSPVNIDHPRLETNLSIWTRTPRGRKISFSSGFRLRKVGGKKLPQYFGALPLSKIPAHAQAVGGKILKVSKSYIKWDVNAEKLTKRLVENNVVAYQVSLLPTLNEEARNAEDAAKEQDYEAIPLNNKGKAVAPPVKLRHVLNQSYGTDLHVIVPVAPLLSDKATTGLHPPPS